MSLTRGTSFKMGMYVSPQKDWRNRIGLCGNAYHFGSADWFPAVEPESRPARPRVPHPSFAGLRKKVGTLNLFRSNTSFRKLFAGFMHSLRQFQRENR